MVSNLANLSLFVVFMFLALKAGMASHKERTFLAVKPDGVQRGLVNEVIKRFEQRGYKLVAMKLLVVSDPLLVLACFRWTTLRVFFSAL